MAAKKLGRELVYANQKEDAVFKEIWVLNCDEWRPILPNILVSCAVLTATVPEGQYSYSLTCICPSEWLYLPGCLHVLQPNLPLCCLIFKSKALAGRCGTTDWILHTNDTSSHVSLLKLLPSAILNNSLVKCFKNGGICGLDFPYHSPVRRMFSNLYLSWGGNSTRKQTSGHWYHTSWT